MRRHRFDQPSTYLEMMNGLRADYDMMRESRFRRRRTGLAPSGAGADYHYRTESRFLQSIEEARDLDRNHSLVGQTLDRAVVNMMPENSRPDPDTGDADLNKDLLARWIDWSEDPDQCDVAAEHSFVDMEFFVQRGMFLDGDQVALGTDPGALELVEAHRIRTPRKTARNVVHGILLGPNREHREYWCTKQDINPMMPLTFVRDIEAYPTRDPNGIRQVFHLRNTKRSSQTRGITALAPIFDTLGMFDDTVFARLVQQQVVSCFAIFRERTEHFDAGASPAKGQQTTETLADGSTRLLEGISPGMDISGPIGEKFTGFSPNIPNPEFFPFMRLILTLVGINLGLPLVMILMDASETNFSGWRGAVDQARMGFRWNHGTRMRRFNRPVYVWKLHQWLSDDAALRNAESKREIRFFQHKWPRPRWRYIQPLQDAQADLLISRNVLNSPRRIHAERGADWDEIHAETVQDNSKAIENAMEAAAKLNKQHPGEPDISWRELLFLPTPDGVTLKAEEAGGAGNGK